jgi:hypothetical protein
MSDWSSFEQDKFFKDAWKNYLSENNAGDSELKEGRFGDALSLGKGAAGAIGGFLKGLNPDTAKKRLAQQNKAAKRAGRSLTRTAKQLKGKTKAASGAESEPYGAESEPSTDSTQQASQIPDETSPSTTKKQNGAWSTISKPADTKSDSGPTSEPASPPEKSTTTSRRELHPVNAPHPSGIKFDDLSSLTGLAVQSVLRQLDKDDLVLALKGATQDVEDLFLANVSSRAADDIREKMEIMGPVPRSRIRTAQERIVSAAVKLADSGTIYIPFYSGRKETPTEKTPTKKASTKKVKPVRGQGKTTPKAAAPELSRAQRRQNKSKGSGTVRSAGGSRGMPTQQQSRSRRNQRENIDLTLKELIKEELLRVLNEEE